MSGGHPGPAARLVVGFDLDQTLVDSRARIEASLQQALESLGGPGGPVSIGPYQGLPLADTAQALWPEVDLDAFVPAYRAAYDGDHHRGLTAAMPGAGEALAAVCSAGGQAVVVSAKYPPAVVTALREAGLAQLVALVHGDAFGDEKAVVLRDARAQIYVGDHVADVRAAVLAGATSVAVATGAYGPDALRAAGADVVLATLAEFAAWFTGFVRVAPGEAS